MKNKILKHYKRKKFFYRFFMRKSPRSGAMFGLAWIGFLFIPRFCKKQLWKTLIFACCYTVPLLAEGIDFAQKMQYQLDYGKLLGLLVVMTFLFHPAVWLICLVWNIVDIVKNNKLESENAGKFLSSPNGLFGFLPTFYPQKSSILTEVVGEDKKTLTFFSSLTKIL